MKYKQLGDTKNAQRKTDVNIILNAVYQYAIDNNGTIPPTITASSTEICKTLADCGSLIDLGVLTTNEKYLAVIPVDPKGGVEATGTGYYISKTVNNRITVTAPQAEQGIIITATR